VPIEEEEEEGLQMYAHQQLFISKILFINFKFGWQSSLHYEIERMAEKNFGFSASRYGPCRPTSPSAGFAAHV
jgi:hypothetical protein